MNFLAHLALSGDDPETIVGNLMGDFVKGRLEGRFPPGIHRGLLLHRKIDFFAEENEHFIRSRRRLDDRFGFYRGVLVDLFYDHYLAAGWHRYSGVPLPDYLAAVAAVAAARRDVLPERLSRRLPDLFGAWLPSYRTIGGIDDVLKRMSARLTRENPLAEGGGELTRHYAELQGDFDLFYPQLQQYAAEFLQSQPGG